MHFQYGLAKLHLCPKEISNKAGVLCTAQILDPGAKGSVSIDQNFQSLSAKAICKRRGRGLPARGQFATLIQTTICTLTLDLSCLQHQLGPRF